MNQFEATFHSESNIEILYQLWSVESPKGTILITHGLAEHSECYLDFAAQLNSWGWNVIAWDLRGHGRSSGRRGYVGNFRYYDQDLKLLVDLVKKEIHPPGIPFILFGHSLGGLICLNYILEYGNPGIDALCLSSPALGFAIEIPQLKGQFAQWASNWLPKVTLHNEINFNDLTRDPKLVASYSKDPFRHEKISPRIFTGMMDSYEFVKNHANKITLPLLMQLAGNDRIVSAAASNFVFNKISSSKKQTHTYNYSLHEIYNDLDKKIVFEDLKKFISGIA